MNTLPYNISDALLPVDNFAITAYMKKWKLAASINTNSIYWNPTTKLTDAQYSTIKNGIKADLTAIENQISSLQSLAHTLLNNTQKEIDFIVSRSNNYKIGNTMVKTAKGQTLKDLMIEWKTIKQANNALQYELRFSLKPGYSLIV